MAALAAHSSLQSVSGCRLASVSLSSTSRRCVVRPVCAEDKKQKLDFTPNRRSGVGYIDEDSAGQTNIFAVEPKRYVKGSSRDETSTGANVFIGIGAAVLGALVLGAAVLGGGVNGGISTPSDEGLMSLTEYSQKFTGER